MLKVLGSIPVLSGQLKNGGNSLLNCSLNPGIEPRTRRKGSVFVPMRLISMMQNRTFKIFDAKNDLDKFINCTSDTNRNVVQNTNKNFIDTGIQTEETDNIDILQQDLKYHFMDPYKKIKEAKNISWNLLVQILKLILISIQVRLNLFLFLYITGDKKNEVQYYAFNIYAHVQHSIM